jgi:16S rRNA processing protein RimM
MVLLGRIGAAHGIRGEVLVASFTEAPENIAAYGPLTDAAGVRAFEISIVRKTEKGIVARIKGVGSRTAAEALLGTELFVARARLPATADDEFYHADLIGLEAVSPDGRNIGIVVAVENYGAGDLLEIRTAGSTRTELVPFTDAFVPDIDIARRRAVVILPEPAPDDEAPARGGPARRSRTR